MRILHVVPTYVPAYRHGGPVRSVHGLAKAQAAAGHEVTVVTTDVDGPDRLDVPLGEPVDVEGVTTWYFPVRWPERLYHAPEAAAHLEREIGGFAVAHLHSVFLLPTRAAARAAARAGVPYLVSPRGMLVRDLVSRRGRWRKTFWLHAVERHTLAAAAGLHVTSRLEAREAARFRLPLPEPFVVPNGFEPVADPGAEAVRPELAALASGSPGGRQPPFVLFLGRLSWKKGLNRLLNAFSRLPGAPRLVLAGPDDEGLSDDLTRRARELGIDRRLHLPGAVYDADKAFLLHRAAVLALPSYSENFGNVVVEALGAGTPVVTNPEVGAAEVVSACGGGLVTDGAPEPLAEALTALLGDPEEARRRGEAGRRHAHAHLTWPRLAEAVEKVYEKIGVFS